VPATSPSQRRAEQGQVRPARRNECAEVKHHNDFRPSTNARIVAQIQRLAARLQSALTHRAVIDQAIGIMISRSGVSHDDPNARLRLLSRREHTKLAVVAEGIVRVAVRRARARDFEQT